MPRPFCGFIVGAVAATLFTTAPAAAQPVPTQQLERDGITLRLTPRRGGLELAVNGVTLIKHSSIVVTRPPWAPHYYVGPDHTAVQTATVGTGPTPQLTVEHRGANDLFTATETYKLLDGGRLEQTFVARLKDAEDVALIQWRIGGLAPGPLVGRPYHTTTRDGDTQSGTVPVIGVSGTREERSQAHDFARFTVDSRIGPITIEVLEGPPLTVYDFRTDRWAEPHDPFFWFGDLGSHFRPDEPHRYRIIYHLPTPQQTRMTANPIQAQATPTRAPHAQRYPREKRLVPAPKEVRWQTGAADLTTWRQHLPPRSANPATHPAHALLEQTLGQYPAAAATESGASRPELVMTPATGDQLPEEGYTLNVSPDHVKITANDTAGFRHAVRTLAQLLVLEPDNTLHARGVAIRDWPAVPYRGIHLFTGGQGPQLHLDLVNNVLAPLKMNELVLEAEYVEWDHHPELHHPEYGMPKADVRTILAACDAAGINVTPLVNSLGHMQWAFHDDANLDIAEDPEAKWAYTVTNPRSYEFIFNVYSEALELFNNPKWFHIGHDEFDDRGRVPYRASSKPYTVAELFMMDIAKHHEWFTARDTRIMIWGDMLLAQGEAPDATHADSQEEAQRMRAALPDDVIITDWHYIDTDPANFTSLEIFADEGHDTIAATWYRPGNITNFTHAAYRNDSWGLLHTTWAGYSLDPQSFAREMHQYGTYVLAAEAAWNADDPPHPATYPTQTLFLDYMNLSTLQPANRTGWTADLANLYNQPLVAAGANDWFGLGPQFDLRNLPTGSQHLNGVQFQLPAQHSPAQAGALILQSKLTPDPQLPTQATLTLDARAATLVLLAATSFPSRTGTPIADVTVTFADGPPETFALTYAQNIAAYTDLNALPAAPLAWTGETAAGQRVALRAIPWTNPHPTRPIRSITFKGRDAAGSLILVGLTGFTADTPAEPQP